MLPRPLPTRKKCVAKRNIFDEEGDTINTRMNGAKRSVFFVFIEFSDKFGTE